jgi:hypothetical protein
MKVCVCVIALLATVSTAVVAKDLKQDQNAPAPTVKATVMSDADMDKVTAGSGPGFGLSTAGGNGFEHGFNNGISPHAAGNAQSPVTPGFGLCTAGRASCP